MLSDVDCLRFSGTNAQILAPKVDIGSTPKLVVLLCLHPPNKHLNVGSTLFLGWYDVAMSHNAKSTLKQRCVCQCWNLQRRTMLKQRCVFQRWTEQR